MHLAGQDTHPVAAANYQRHSPASTSAEVAEVVATADVRTVTAAVQTAKVVAGRMGTVAVRTETAAGRKAGVPAYQAVVVEAGRMFVAGTEIAEMPEIAALQVSD